MSDLIRQAEAAGLYIESSQSSIAKEDVEMFCSACGKVLMQRKKGEMLFTQTHGKCTCSWHCCEATASFYHEWHLTYRPTTGAPIWNHGKSCPPPKDEV